MRKRFVQASWTAGAVALCIGLTGCPEGGGPVQGPVGQTPDISLTLAASSVLAPQDGTPASVNVAIGRVGANANSVTLSATG
jgi:hypothetical protein